MPYPTLLVVLDESLALPRIILLRGPEAVLEAWQAALRTRLGARDMLLCQSNGLRLPAAPDNPEADRPTAWICC